MYQINLTDFLPGIPTSEFVCKVTKQAWESVEISCSPLRSPTSRDQHHHYLDSNNKSIHLQNHNDNDHINERRPVAIYNNNSNYNSIKRVRPHKHLGDLSPEIPNPNTINKLPPSKDDKWLGLEKDALGVKVWGNRPDLEQDSLSETSAAMRVDQLQYGVDQDDLNGSEDETRYQLTVRERDSDILIHNTTGEGERFIQWSTMNLFN